MIYLPNTIYIASIITYIQQQISDASMYTQARENQIVTQMSYKQVCSRFLQNSETPPKNHQRKYQIKGRLLDKLCSTKTLVLGTSLLGSIPKNKSRKT